MSVMTSQITSLTIVYSVVYSGTDQRKHQSSAPWAFVREIHRSPVNSPHKGPGKPGLYSMRAYTRAYADCRRNCLYFYRRLRPAHTHAYADCRRQIQTYWTFKASADQRRHHSQSRKRSKVTEGRRVVLHRDVCGRIPTHTLACLYFDPRRTGIRKRRYLRRLQAHTRAWSINPALKREKCFYLMTSSWLFMLQTLESPVSWWCCCE